jgi:hypothetical protein
MQLSLHRGMSDVLLFSRAGFNVETVEYKNISFTVWDVGGQDKVNGLSSFSCHPPCTATWFSIRSADLLVFRPFVALLCPEFAPGVLVAIQNAESQIFLLKCQLLNTAAVK